MTSENPEYIYVFKYRHADNVYKFGATRRTIMERYSEYGFNVVKICFFYCIPKCFHHETEILQILRRKFNNRKEIGREYFEGNINEIIDSIHDYILYFQNYSVQNIKIENEKIVIQNNTQIDEEVDKKVEERVIKQVIERVDEKVNKQINKQANKQADKQTDKQTDKEVDKQVNEKFDYKNRIDMNDSHKKFIRLDNGYIKCYNCLQEYKSEVDILRYNATNPCSNDIINLNRTIKNKHPDQCEYCFDIIDTTSSICLYHSQEVCEKFRIYKLTNTNRIEIFKHIVRIKMVDADSLKK